MTSDIMRPSTDDRSALATVASEDAGHSEYYREELEDLKNAISILAAGHTKAAIDAGPACLREDTVEWWETLKEEDEENVLDSEEGLHAFLTTNVVPEVDKLTRGIDQSA